MRRWPFDPERRQATLLLWLANVGLGSVVGANWLAHVPAIDRPVLWLFALPALLSTVAILTVLPGLALLGVARLVRSERWVGIVHAAFWTVFQILLFVDTRLFNIFRYHFNGQVLNLVYTRGSQDAVHLGWQVWTAIVLGLGGGAALQLWLWRRCLRAARAGRARRPGWLRPSIVWATILLPAIFLEKTIYAQADLARDRQITALARLFPLYARVPLEDLASKVFGLEREETPRVEVEGYALDYPHAVPDVDPEGPRPNVLVVVVDCLRKDMLAPDTMPRLHAWSRDARRFEDHVSGGNSTRYGLFALLYGLYGSYWFPVLQERRSPVLVDVLLDLGYDLRVFSSASMNYPELRETAWVRIPDRVRDDFPGEAPWQRDEQAADALLAWLGERGPRDGPFFAFLLLDSPHQTYSHPPEATPFQPSALEVDYISMTRNEGPEPRTLEAVRNRYKNAVRHADDVTGRILEAVADGHRGDSTLVFVTGDHGEEFLECGFFGHTSAFTPWQVAVPFLARGPGIEPGSEERPTSHVDFAPTLLELLGADPSVRSGWTLGESLFDPPDDRRRVLSGWNELGVWSPHGILRVPLSPLEFDVELYDYRWRLETQDRDVLAAESETLEELGARCNRFLLKRSRGR